MMDKGKLEQLEFFWIVAWHIWWNCNKQVHGVDTNNEHTNNELDIFSQVQRMSDENKQLLPQVRAPHVHTKGTWQRLIQMGPLFAKTQVRG